VPHGVPLNNINFNLRKRSARIGDEQWKLLDEEVGNIRMIQPIENSDKFEFGILNPSSS
jgi:hypothetical protein